MLLSETEDHAGANVNRRVCYQASRSRRPYARGEVFCAEPGRSRERPIDDIGTISEGANRTGNMYVHEKSDMVVVPKKAANKGATALAE